MSKQSSQNLATKIVAQMAEYEAIEGGGYTVTVPQLGYRHDHVNTKTETVKDRNRDGSEVEDSEEQEIERRVKTTKAEAGEMAAATIADMLENGDLVLSDTWAEDNLKSEK